MNKRIRLITVSVVVGSALLVGACNKKVSKVTPPPPPPPVAPTATLAADPSVVQQGQSVELSWQTTNANSVSIQGVGDVSTSGSRSVGPSESMTYTLVAHGPGGTQEATARVTVNPAVHATATADDDTFARNLADVFFDFDKSDLRSDQLTVAQKDAKLLAQHPNLTLVIAGHCDDRGSEEYNLALGDNRANAFKKALVAEGIPAERLRTVSYGKEKPFCSDQNEQCWYQNRRDHLSVEH